MYITVKQPLPKVQPSHLLESEQDSMVSVPISNSYRNQKMSGSGATRAGCLRQPRETSFDITIYHNDFLSDSSNSTKLSQFNCAVSNYMLFQYINGLHLPKCQPVFCLYNPVTNLQCLSTVLLSLISCCQLLCCCCQLFFGFSQLCSFQALYVLNSLTESSFSILGKIKT